MLQGNRLHFQRMRLKLGIFGVLLVIAQSFAAEPKTFDVKSAQSIPLPRQSHYLRQGLQTGMGLGTIYRSGCTARFQWQGGAEYSYTKHISGGGAVRLFGGAVDNETSLTYMRYFTHARYHVQPNPKLDIYVGPVLGLENTSFSEMRASWENRNEEDSTDLNSESSTCEDAYSINGPSLGWDVGTGWLPHPLIGLTASNSAEVNFQRKVRVSFTGGVAFNLYEISSRMQSYLTASWVHFDLVKAFTVNHGGSENSILLGMSVGF